MASSHGVLGLGGGDWETRPGQWPSHGLLERWTAGPLERWSRWTAGALERWAVTAGERATADWIWSGRAEPRRRRESRLARLGRRQRQGEKPRAREGLRVRRQEGFRVV